MGLLFLLCRGSPACTADHQSLRIHTNNNTSTMYQHTTNTTENVRIIMLPSHSCGDTLQIKCCTAQHRHLLTVWVDSSKSAVWRKRWHLVSHRNVKSEEQAQVSGGRLFHARAAATGKARSPRVARRVDGTCNVVVSAKWRQRRAMIYDVGRRLSDKYHHHHHKRTD